MAKLNHIEVKRTLKENFKNPGQPGKKAKGFIRKRNQDCHQTFQQFLMPTSPLQKNSVTNLKY